MPDNTRYRIVIQYLEHP